MVSHKVESPLSACSPFSPRPVFGSLAEVWACLLWPVCTPFPLCSQSALILPLLLPCSAPLPHSQRERLVFPGSYQLEVLPSSLKFSSFLSTEVVSPPYSGCICWVVLFETLPTGILWQILAFFTWTWVCPTSVSLPRRWKALSLHSAAHLALTHSGRKKLLFPTLKGYMFPRALQMNFSFQLEEQKWEWGKPISGFSSLR